MIEKVGYRVLSNPNNIQRQDFKNNTTITSVGKDIKFAKIPAANYQVMFIGRKYNNPNSKRKYTDYGNSLYIGSQPLPVDSKEVYSVNRYKAKAKHIQLDNADLRNYNFEKANFYRACFQGANLENSNFDRTNLYNANMRNIKTKDTKFINANLNFADFSCADFGRRTDMRGANVIGATFSSDLKYVNLQDALYDQSTIFPEGFDPLAEDMIPLDSGSDLSNLGKRLEFAKMRFITLEDVNFKNSSLKRADLKHIDITRCNFEDTNMSRVYAPEIEARNCSFKNAKMKQTNFDGAIFENVDMSNTDLRGVIFTFETARNLKLNGAKYDQFTVFNPDFDPKAYGMIYEESNPGVYGAKTEAEIRSFNEWT